MIDGPAWRAARERASAAPDTVSFQPGELQVRVLAGAARARRIRLAGSDGGVARLTIAPLALGPGAAYALDGAREALAFAAIDGGLVSLRLHRRASGGEAAREFDLASGALVHQAASDQSDSRAEMIMALLRAMERSDAAPAVAALAREGEAAARWQALRECLALDSATGLAELASVAGAAGDPLAVPARALLDRLAAQHPAFAAAREALLCPA